MHVAGALVAPFLNDSDHCPGQQCADESGVVVSRVAHRQRIRRSHHSELTPLVARLAARRARLHRLDKYVELGRVRHSAEGVAEADAERGGLACNGARQGLAAYGAVGRVWLRSGGDHVEWRARERQPKVRDGNAVVPRLGWPPLHFVLAAAQRRDARTHAGDTTHIHEQLRGLVLGVVTPPPGVSPSAELRGAWAGVTPSAELRGAGRHGAAQRRR